MLFRSLLRAADFVSLHLALNEQTRHTIGAHEIALMKPTGCLINTSRGGLIDEAALVRALREGRIAGAGLDVLEHEPPDKSNPLLQMDNVVVTGHSAASTEQAPQALLEEWKTMIGSYLSGEWPANVVNPGVVPRRALVPARQ